MVGDLGFEGGSSFCYVYGSCQETICKFVVFKFALLFFGLAVWVGDLVQKEEKQGKFQDCKACVTNINSG